MAIKLALNMLKHLMNLWNFSMLNSFSWGRGWALIIILCQNVQNSSFLHTCSILVAPSCPLNIQNSPLIISSIKATKNVPLNVSHVPPEYLRYQLFRFQFSKLYVRFRQVAFIY